MTSHLIPGILPKGNLYRDHSELAAFKVWSPLVASDDFVHILCVSIYKGWGQIKKKSKSGDIETVSESTEEAKNEEEDQLSTALAKIPTPKEWGASVGEMIVRMGHAIRQNVLASTRHGSLAGVRFLQSADKYDLSHYAPSLRTSVSSKGFKLFNAYCEELGDAFLINPVLIYQAFWKTVIASSSMMMKKKWSGRSDIPIHLINDYIQRHILGHSYDQGLPYNMSYDKEGFTTGHSYTKYEYGKRGKNMSKKKPGKKRKFYY